MHAIIILKRKFRIVELVSIVLTTHNGVDTISRCLKAAVNQDYPSFEIIVVDDNGRGTQNQILTEKIVKSFPYSNIKYVVHEYNKNGSAARNTGILHSKGNYIAFLDDDDELTTDSISIRMKAFENCDEKIGVSLGSFIQYIDGTNPAFHVVGYNGKVTKEIMCLKYSTPSSIILIKRSVIDKIGFWDESFKRHQDWEFLVRASRCFDFFSTDRVICNRYVTWRNNPKSPKLFKKYRLYFLRKMSPYICSFNKNDINDILFVHYFDIGKQYLKRKRLFSALYWFFRTKKPVLCLKKILNRRGKNV